MKKLKILYAGSPLASAIVLKTLYDFSKSQDGNFEISAVLTNPPSARGRSSALVPTEVCEFARQNGIPCFSFEHLNGEAREEINKIHADILVCFDYGKIFGPKFLSLFELGGINLHPSSLPKYRGCTPVPAAILNGDKTLGITVQKISLKTDEGDILAIKEIELDGTETTQSLMDGDGKSSIVTKTGAELILGILNSIKTTEDGKFIQLNGTPQTGESSYTNFINKEDGKIDWNENAEKIDRKIRAYTPWPQCRTTFDGKSLIISKAFVSAKKTTENAGTVLPYDKTAGIEIACGDGTVLSATELQLQGKKSMDYKSFINGARNLIGSVLV